MASIALLLIYHDDGFVMNAIIRSKAVESSYSYSSYNNNNYNYQVITLKSSRRSSRRSYGGDGVGGGMTMKAAPFKRPRAQNVPGNLYVDESCIDCDACRWICPSVFNRYTISIYIVSFYIYIYMLIYLLISLSVSFLQLVITTGLYVLIDTTVVVG